MNVLIQHDPRSIALRGAGQDPYALIFRHASREEDSSNRCVVEFLPWKDVSERSEYKLLNSVEVYGSLGLIDIEEGSLPPRHVGSDGRCLYMRCDGETSSSYNTTWRNS
jgi:hypothetical protein